MRAPLPVRWATVRAHWESAFGFVGLLGLFVALLVDRPAAVQAAGQTWTPFVLVAGLILIGLAAADDGLFGAIGDRLADRAPGDLSFLVGAALLITVVTATLNLDTSVVFVTPVLLAAAARRGRWGAPLLYGSLLLANASSLFLPGSNLTNLIVLGHGTRSGAFASLLWPAAVAATVVTALVVGLWGWRGHRRNDVIDSAEPSAAPPGPIGWAAAAVGVTLVVVLFVPWPAPVVLGLGLVVSALRLHRGQVTVHRAVSVVAPQMLVGLFGVATALGTVGRAWSGSSIALAHAGFAGTAVLAALSTVVLNNLPAAALLAARHPAHAPALLVGLNLGPNLFVTGSLAWFLWLRIARMTGATPSVYQASRLGLVVVPLSMAAALLALAWA